jgi:hypothetical protein
LGKNHFIINTTISHTFASQGKAIPKTTQQFSTHLLEGIAFPKTTQSFPKEMLFTFLLLTYMKIMYMTRGFELVLVGSWFWNVKPWGLSSHDSNPTQHAFVRTSLLLK